MRAANEPLDSGGPRKGDTPLKENFGCRSGTEAISKGKDSLYVRCTVGWNTTHKSFVARCELLYFVFRICDCFRKRGASRRVIRSHLRLRAARPTVRARARRGTEPRAREVCTRLAGPGSRGRGPGGVRACGARRTVHAAAASHDTAKNIKKL